MGLPATVRACLFDLDGVLTDTARLHAAAWKEMFDAYLEARANEAGAAFAPFDELADYAAYVDGKSRSDGTISFLHSRGIELPLGSRGVRLTSDSSYQTSDLTRNQGDMTITRLGEYKNAIVMRRIRDGGVEPYPGSVYYVQAVRSAGLKTAVVSSSANCAEVLLSAGIADLFQARIDGVTIEAQCLAGKPAPDPYLAAAAALGIEPCAAAVFEDSLPGVRAGRAGGFGWVVGVDRVGQTEDLLADGADQVVLDLGDLLSKNAPS
ncbi:HAD family hydrolase [Nakamurella antarctica]|uniref:HAD family hydrolase n=1 Tax=Nakamurella antarctica TaxID=1902245 RepID=A0A3G8ZQ33_9ACTN|nr:HAD family hydrolase [Nakamurella antarctica]